MEKIAPLGGAGAADEVWNFNEMLVEWDGFGIIFWFGGGFFTPPKQLPQGPAEMITPAASSPKSYVMGRGGEA